GNSPTLGRGGSKPDLGVDTNAPQRDLLLALERREIVEVRNAMSRIPEGKQKAVLLAPSKKPQHKLRTPLMAATATGDIAILGAVLDGFNRLFRPEDN
ncbi:unnamed protein product, partial [Sphacelaria rigidula]